MICVPLWPDVTDRGRRKRSEEHTSELQSHLNLVWRLLLENKKQIQGPRQRNETPHLRHGYARECVTAPLMSHHPAQRLGISLYDVSLFFIFFFYMGPPPPPAPPSPPPPFSSI